LFYKFGITFKDFHRRTANEIFNLKQLAWFKRAVNECRPVAMETMSIRYLA
jgi:hypothetical protein